MVGRGFSKPQVNVRFISLQLKAHTAIIRYFSAATQKVSGQLKSLWKAVVRGVESPPPQYNVL